MTVLMADDKELDECYWQCACVVLSPEPGRQLPSRLAAVNRFQDGGTPPPSRAAAAVDEEFLLNFRMREHIIEFNFAKHPSLPPRWDVDRMENPSGPFTRGGNV
ncbi:hypothetical protein J6590_016826 [Homalodisca vitripennis]|nr:hypothetical protein J6590_016826 [Homalodisca vitripennis]